MSAELPGGARRSSRAERWQTGGLRGATIWLTGLSGAGKSTLGAALEERLLALGRPAYLLDGDQLRAGLCRDLSFSAEDRQRNVLRVGELARLFADAGLVAIVALISPYRSGRDTVRELHRRDSLSFLEVHLATPLEVCAARDPKGLYARSRAGELRGLTGVDAPYEPPEHPDLRFDEKASVMDAAAAVLALLPPTQEAPKPRS